MAVRNWLGADSSPTEGQKTILETGWQNVTVKRVDDDSRDVGVTQELDAEEISFTIQARIDPLESKQAAKQWIGLVHPHILPMMRKGDTWLTEKPNERVQSYRVQSINADEIILERV